MENIYEYQYTGAPVAGEPDRKRCIDCGMILDSKRGKICKVCKDFRKAFTENKYGELA